LLINVEINERRCGVMARYIDTDVMKDDIIKLRRTLDTDKCSNDFACGWVIGVDNMEGLIDRQPTADVVEVKHGEWMWDTEDNYECSLCGTKTRVDEVMGMPTYNYCPKCGTKMDGDEK
jgi:DNA-directed RNA polymerase subunit RPC12/RpoP